MIAPVQDDPLFPERPASPAGEDQALEALRLGWNDTYEFGLGLDGYWARRRDGLGDAMISHDPEEVRRQVHEDYGMWPAR